MFDVICMGSATMDVFAKTEAGAVDVLKNKGRYELAYPLGEKILIKELEFQIGGGGVNTSIGFSKLGLNSALLGKIGKDVNGLKIFKRLKEENVAFLGDLGNKSGYSIVLDAVKRDRTILVYKGENSNIDYKNIDLKKLRTKFILFGSLMGKSLNSAKKLAAYCKKNNIKIMFNPSSYLAKKGVRNLKDILKNCDILVLNREEAEILLNKKTDDIKKLIKNLKKTIPGIAVITDGKKGVYVLDTENNYYHGFTTKINIKETTGAGDAFVSGFGTGIIMEKSIKDCIKMGLCNSESVIQHYGAQNGILTKTQLIRKIKKDKRKIISDKI